MALINCPECEFKISDKSKHCIHCGYPLAESMAMPELISKNEGSNAENVGKVEDKAAVPEQVTQQQVNRSNLDSRCTECFEMLDGNGTCPYCSGKKELNGQVERSYEVGSSAGAINGDSYEWFFTRLIYGREGLAKTYWIYGVVIGGVFSIIARFSDNLVMPLWSILYGIVIIFAVWNAATRYKGNAIWKYLAKTTCVLSTIKIILFIVLLSVV